MEGKLVFSRKNVSITSCMPQKVINRNTYDFDSFKTGIAVGAYQSDKTFLLFTKPVIRLITQLHLPPEILIKEGRCDNETCSYLIVNISYTGENVPSNISKYSYELVYTF